jgi:putative spermidine/putrescine transport system ATP-binding protein
MTQVILDHLYKTYPKLPAVDDLSLTIPAGQITALLGPSGCGKTTVLKMIAGLIEPTQGDILFNQQSVRHIPTERRGAVMVFQNHLLFPYMSVGDNVGFGLKMQGVDQLTVNQKVAEMLELVKLPGLEQRRPKQLSGGQQQRVALARALVVEPKVLLLDEPLSNLDAHLRGEMRELIQEIQHQLNITTIFVTHDQEEATIIADQIALLFEGKLQQFGYPRAFYEQPATTQVAQFFGGVNFISGTKRGTTVETELAVFDCPQQSIKDGPVVLTIRPENLRLSKETDFSRYPNLIRAEIDSCLYLGTHVRFKLTVSNNQFEVIADAGHADQFQVGQPVDIYFPPERVWLLRH